MSVAASLNRRAFIRTTTVAAAGLAIFDTGEAESVAASVIQGTSGLIDTNISVGRWPFRRLPLDDTSALVAKLRKQGVAQAWAGNFDAAFGNNISAANAWLAKECDRRGRSLLAPFGSVNPTVAGWETELHRCEQEYHMPGLRLHPNYHGYKLDDEAFVKLLSVADERGLIIQIGMSLEDERTQPSSARTPHVDAKPLLTLLKTLPGLRVVLLNWHRAMTPALVKSLAQIGVSFDIATVENVGGVAKLVGEISSDRVLFGSHAPFFYFESALLKLKESALDDSGGRAVLRENARRLMTRPKKRG